MLFKSMINGNSSWAEIFQSIDVFKPLIETIFIKHELTIDEIENLTPGTNAVFRIKDKVIKIFAPIESGYSTDKDYFTELSALQHAHDVQITAPSLVHTGAIEDRYLFRYIIMEFINGEEADQRLRLYNAIQKSDFAYKLKTITEKLNIKVSQYDFPVFELKVCLENKKWTEFSNDFCQDRVTYIRSKSFADFVYTHGDLTGENIIIDEKGEIYLIDFADSRIAPFYYEWSPIVFALFGCDPVMLEAYFGSYHNDAFYDMLTLSLLIHEYGSNILQQICELAGISIHSITEIHCLKEMLIKIVEGGHMKVR